MKNGVFPDWNMRGRGKRNNGREIKIKKRSRTRHGGHLGRWFSLYKAQASVWASCRYAPNPPKSPKIRGQQLKEWIDLGFLVNPVQGSDSIRMGNHDGFGACPTYRVPAYSTARDDWIDFSSFPFCRALASLRSWLTPMIMPVTVSKGLCARWSNMIFS